MLFQTDPAKNVHASIEYPEVVFAIFITLKILFDWLDFL